jgi:hypothetical protein
VPSSPCLIRLLGGPGHYPEVALRVEVMAFFVAYHNRICICHYRTNSTRPSGDPPFGSRKTSESARTGSSAFSSKAGFGPGSIIHGATQCSIILQILKLIYVRRLTGRRLEIGSRRMPEVIRDRTQRHFPRRALRPAPNNHNPTTEARALCTHAGYQSCGDSILARAQTPTPEPVSYIVCQRRMHMRERY